MSPGRLAVRTGYNDCGGAVLQELTPQSRNRFSQALVPAEFIPRWWLGIALAWSEAVPQVRWFWGLPGGAGEGQLPVPCLGPPRMSYKAI